MLNELYSDRWDGETDDLLTANGFLTPAGNPFPKEWIGYSFAYMVPYILLCTVLSAIGLIYVRSNEGGGASSVPLDSTTEEDREPEENIEIPFKPLTVSFRDLGYEVKASTSKEQLMLLHKVNGIFRPGRMCALMVS
jgi:hypothetical protein